MSTGRSQKKLLPVAVGAALATLGTGAFASGFQIQEQNASGLGLAYSGMAAAVQDASTAFWNPAGQTRLQGIQGAFALSYIIPDTKYTDGPSPPPAVSNFNPAAGNGGNGGDSALVPAMYGTWLINPQWSVGLGINAPFGLATEWSAPWQGQFHALRSEIETLNINPTVAFKVNNDISIGAGISYQRLKATLTSAANLAGTSIAQVEGDDWAWGWNIGALFNLVSPDTQLGLTYRSTIGYTVEGNLTVTGVPVATPVKADIKLPSNFSVGISHRLNPKIRLLADWTWTGWDTIQQLTIVNANTGATAQQTNLSFKNSWRVGGGVEWEVHPQWLLRGGLAYDTSPVQDQFRTPRLPDNDRTWLSLGARFAPSPNWWLDFGYTYIWVNDGNSQLTPNTLPPGNLVGTYKTNINILAAQVSFKF